MKTFFSLVTKISTLHSNICSLPLNWLCAFQTILMNIYILSITFLGIEKIWFDVSSIHSFHTVDGQLSHRSLFETVPRIQPAGVGGSGVVCFRSFPHWMLHSPNGCLLIYLNTSSLTLPPNLSSYSHTSLSDTSAHTEKRAHVNKTPLIYKRKQSSSCWFHIKSA